MVEKIKDWFRGTQFTRFAYLGIGIGALVFGAKFVAGAGIGIFIYINFNVIIKRFNPFEGEKI